MKAVRIVMEDGVIAMLDSSEYRQYLSEHGHLLPASARAFAEAEWHYEHLGKQSLHDSWLESLTVMERSDAGNRRARSTEITIRLLGPFHNGLATIKYEKSVRYSIEGKLINTPSTTSLGDWLIDEVSVADSGLVLHEIVFTQGKIIVECADIQYEWVDFH